MTTIFAAAPAFVQQAIVKAIRERAEHEMSNLNVNSGDRLAYLAQAVNWVRDINDLPMPERP